MEPVRNGGNGMDSGSPIAILTADILRLDRKLDDRVSQLDDRVSKLDDRVGALEARVGGLDVRIGRLEVRVDQLVVNVREMSAVLVALGERVARVETGIDFLRSDMKNLGDGLLAVRTTDFRLMFGALIAVALSLAAMMAKGFGWL